MGNVLEVPVTIEVDCDTLGGPQEVMERIHAAVTAAANHCGFSAGTIGVLITDDDTIHAINQQHLQHDYPTDVISFAYEQTRPLVQGELVASLPTAVNCAQESGSEVLHELLLYVVHGTLHICGLDDQTVESRAEMRRSEATVLKHLGITDVSPVDR